jgi:hypothetical protein
VAKVIINVKAPVVTEKTLVTNYSLQTSTDIG